MKTLVVNFFGGPGVGKSSTCAGVFSGLKWHDVNCEMALEFAKDKVWEGSEHVLTNQLYIFGKQYHRIWRLSVKVDVILTDTPILNSLLYYEGGNSHFLKMVVAEHAKLRNLNILLSREKDYNPAGRLQSEEKAKSLDLRIREILDYLEEPYIEIPANSRAIPEIVSKICYHGLSRSAVDYITRYLKRPSSARDFVEITKK